MPDLIITPGSGLIEFVKEGAQSPTVYRLEMAEGAGLILNAPLTSSVGMKAPNMMDSFGNNIFSGTSTFNGPTIINGNLSVFGTTNLFSASNVYISSSQLTIEDNILTLNAFSPFLRYAGIEMIDSGSGTLSSMLWDGQGDYFFLSGSSVNGKILTGPDGQTDLTSGYIPKATAGYKLGNSLIYDDGSRVGISTTAPSSSLTIQSNGTQLRLQTQSAPGSFFANIGARYDSTRPFTIEVANNSSTPAEFMGIYADGGGANNRVVFPTGNIGIGTTNPTQKLEVAGYVMAGEGTYRTNIYASNGGAWIGFGDTSSLNSLGRIGAYGSLFNINSVNGDTSFQYNSAEKMRVTTGGHLGLGITNPAAYVNANGNWFRPSLDGLYSSIYATTEAVVNLISSGSADGAAVGGVYFTGARAQGDAHFQIAAIRAIQSGTSNTIAGGALQFFTKTNNGGTAATDPSMVIGSGGNVGMGTPNPTSRLHISSSTAANVLLESGTTGTSGKLIFKTSDNADLSKYIVQESYYLLFSGNSNEGFKFRDSGNTTLMTIYGTTNSSYANRVGIGTTDPATKLDVVGLNGSFPTSSGATQSTGSILRLRNGNSNLVLDIGGHGGNGNWIQSTNRADLSVNYPLLLNPNGGNVGIGSTSPGTKLDVVGEIRMPVIKQSTTLYAGTDITDDDSTRTVYFNIPSGGYSPSRYFKVARIKITGNYQNVSLNGYFTATNSTGLHVGSERKVEFDFIAYAATNPGAPQVTYLKRGPDTTTVSVYAVPSGSGAGTTHYDVYIRSGWYNDTNGELAIRVGYGSAVTVWQTGLDSGTSAPTDTLVNPNSNYSFDTTGNIGIGSTSPAYKLDVGAAGNNNVSVRLTPGYERVRYYGFDLLGYNDGNLWMMGNNATNTLLLSNNWDWDYQVGFAYTPGTVGNAAGVLQIGQISKNNANYTHGITRLYTNGLERLTIIANGNIGIGTTSPRSTLHVNTVNGSSGNEYAGLTVSATISSSRGVNIAYDATNDIGVIQPVHNGVTWKSLSLVPAAGLVGIGTTSPSGKVHIYENANRVSYLAQNNNHTARFEAYGTATAIDTTASNGIFFRINGGDIVKFAADGAVGIGTSTVGAPLHIYRASNPWIRLNGGGSFGYIRFDDGTSNGYLFKNTSSDTTNGALAGAMYTYTDSGKAFQHIHAGSPLFTILSGGNIGIGTTSPTASLHVNSTTAGATLIRADGTNGTLFSVVDDLSDSLMSVNNSAGLPVFEVFADDRIVAGQYGQNDLVVVNNKVGIGTNNPIGELHVTSSTSIPSAVFLGGNVGIGTSSPGYKLDISGSAYIASTLVFPNTSNAGLTTVDGTALFRLDDIYGNIYLLNTAGGFYVDATSHNFRNASSNNLMTINSSGDVSATRYVYGTYVNTSDDVSTSNITHIVAKFGDNFHRSATAAKVAAFLNNQTMNIAGNAATSTIVNGTNGQLLFKDIRAIAPNNIAAGYLQFGFTTWANTLSTTPYADYLHLRSYTDSSGGNDNLVMFRKDVIGMRIWQQSFGSATNYSTYKDVAFTDQIGNGTITIAAGTGVGVGTTNTFTTNQSGATTVTISNTGVTSNVAGTGISISGATGAVTITNSGVTSAVAGTGVGVSAATGAVTFSIGQAVGTGNTPTFAGATLNGQLNVNHSVSTAIVRLWNAGSTVWSLGVGDTAGSYFNISADFGSILINKTNGNIWISGSGINNTVLHSGTTSAPNLSIGGNAATATNANAISFTEVELNAPVTVSGTWTSGNGSEWGEPKFGTSFNQFRYTDGNGPYVEYNIPANHHSCFISQLQWDTGGYADCHGVQADGDLVFLRRINTRQLVENSNHGNTIQHDGATVTFVGSGLQAFTKIRITNRLGRIHMTGIAFTRQVDDGYEGTGMVHPAQISHQGAGSGLDADLLDGYSSATANTANTIVLRDASGNFSAGTITATLNGNVSGTAGGETLGTVTGRGGSTGTQILVATAAGQAMFVGRQAGAGYSYGSGGIFTAQSDNPNGTQNAFFQGYVSSSATVASGNLTFSIRADGQIYTTMNTATGIANNSFSVGKTITGTIHIANGSGTSGNNRQAAITFQGGSSSEAQAGIYVSNNNSSGTAMGFATTDSYTTGPQLFMTATNTGVVNFSRARPTYAGNALVDVAGGQTIAGITYFSNGESMNVYGIRGRFTNEYLHLYNKVGIGHPGGWGQGEGSTPNQGLSTYGGITIAYGTNATSIFYGNVGIGTTVVNARVESYYASNAITFNYLATNLNVNSPIPVYGFDVTSGAESRSIKAGIGYERHLPNGRGTLHFYNDSTNDTQSLAGNRTTAGDIKMSLDNSGNLGIGTTQPSWLLTVYAASAPQFTLQNGTRSFVLTNNAGDNLLSFNYGSVNRLQFDTTNQWFNTGNLGVGNTSPQYKLHVTQATPSGQRAAPANTSIQVDSNTNNYISLVNTADNGTYAGLTFVDNNIGGYIVFRNYTGDVTTGSDSLIYGTFQDHIFQNSSSETINGKTETMRIKQNGNVGIGSNNPQSKLDVNGVLAFGGVAVLNTANNGNDIYANVRVIRNTSSTSADGMYINYDSAGTTAAHLRFYANAGNERMRIQANDGNVGIGTTSAGRRLDVEGIVRTRGASGSGGFEIGAATTGAAKWRIEWDSASDSLDFNWVG